MHAGIFNSITISLHVEWPKVTHPTKLEKHMDEPQLSNTTLLS